MSHSATSRSYALPSLRRTAGARGVVILLLALGLPSAVLPGCAVRHVPRETDIPGGEQEVPIEARRNRFVAWVGIDGAGPFPFVLDTGASTVVLSADVAERAGLETSGFLWRIHGAASSEWQWRQGGTIETITLGAVTFRETDCLVHEGAESGGYLGNGILAHCTLHVNADWTTFRLATEPLEPRPGDIPIEWSNQVPTVPIDIAGVRGRAILDTGFDWTLRLPSAWEKRLPLTEFRAPATVTTIHGTSEESHRRLDGVLTVGPHTFESPEVVFGPGPALLGLELLRGRAFTLDLRSGILRLGE